MTNLDIETFWAVVQHGTMTAAAEALYITQPTLSMRIRALEERVGAPLFVRGKGQRRITLTAAGQKFLTLAQRWQQLLSETETLAELEQRYPDLKKKLFGAVQRYPLYGWDLEKMEK